DRALAPDPPREEEAEREQAERAREIEPQSRDAVRVDERRERDRRRAPGRQRGEAEEAPEGVERAVGDEIRDLVASRPPAQEKADDENGGQIEKQRDEDRAGHARIMLR